MSPVSHTFLLLFWLVLQFFSFFIRPLWGSKLATLTSSHMLHLPSQPDAPELPFFLGFLEFFNLVTWLHNRGRNEGKVGS